MYRCSSFASRAAFAFAVVLGLAVTAAGEVPPASAAAPATITAPQPVRAPAHAQGGIVSPYVVCGNPKRKPHVMWTLNNVATGWQPTYSWVGATPNARFPRVDPGTYVSTTSVTCKDQQTVRTVTVVVTRKTRSTTMSHAEYRRITHGMRKRTVERIVGYHGGTVAVSGHNRTVAYDEDGFMLSARVRFHRGRVVGKHWTTG